MKKDEEEKRMMIMKNTRTLKKEITILSTNMSIIIVFILLLIMWRRDDMIVEGYYNSCPYMSLSSSKRLSITATTSMTTIHSGSSSSSNSRSSCSSRISLSLFGTRSSTKRTSTLLQLSSTKRDDEIIKLEEQLRQLKLEQEKQDQELQQKQKEEDEIDMNTSNQKFNEILKGKDMILSERELIDGGIVESAMSTMTNNSLVTAVALFVALVGGLIAFSQIPVGQESLTKYSAPIGSSSTSSLLKQIIDLGDLNPDNPNTIK